MTTSYPYQIYSKWFFRSRKKDNVLETFYRKANYRLQKCIKYINKSIINFINLLTGYVQVVILLISQNFFTITNSSSRKSRTVLIYLLLYSTQKLYSRSCASFSFVIAHYKQPKRRLNIKNHPQPYYTDTILVVVSSQGVP